MTKHETLKRCTWALVLAVALWALANVVMISIATFGIDDIATQAAFNAATSVKHSPINESTATAARAVAETYAEQNGAHLVGDFHLNPDGSVSLTVQKHCMNFGLDRISFAKHFTVIEGKASSGGQQG